MVLPRATSQYAAAAIPSKTMTGVLPRQPHQAAPPIGNYCNRDLSHRVLLPKAVEAGKSGGRSFQSSVTCPTTPQKSTEPKNLLLDFQSELLDLEAQEFSRQLQQVVDEEKLLAIVPGTFESFYRVCYLLDRIQKAPDNPGVWLVYLASYFNPDMPALDLARFMFSLDFLYFKCAALQPNELRVVHKAIADAGVYVKSRAGQANGSLALDPRVAPLEETRQILFAVNLLEDLQQDARVSLGIDLPAIGKIFETLPDASQTAGFIAGAQRR